MSGAFATEQAFVDAVSVDGMTTLTLNRPERANALNPAMVEQLLAAVARATDDGTRVLMLRSRARHFCAGFDMDGVLTQTDGDLLLRFVRIEQLLQQLRGAPFLTVACVAGKAIGAGADLAAACTHRLLDPSATLRFPGFRFGVTLGTRHLATLTGACVARSLLMNSHEVDAETAVRIGLGTEIVGRDDFDATVNEVKARCVLDRASVATVLDRTAHRDDDGDMAALVTSLTRPGLKNRLAAYLDNGHS